MDITFEKVGNVSGELTVKMVKADYEAGVEKTLKDYSHKVQMPGFRKGKVPKGLVKKMYGTQIKADAVNKLLQDSLFNYIKENKVNMLGEPLGSEKQVPQDIEKQDDFTFVFDIALAPDFKAELGGGDTVDYYDIEVSDEAVDKQLDSLRQQAGHPEEVEAFAGKDILRGTLAELDGEGKPAEGGLVVENASLMPAYFASDEQKKLFEGVKKNTVVKFNPAKAYEGRDVEAASLLKVKKEEVAAHAGDFNFEVGSVSRFVPAALNQEFFDNAFGKDAVKSEEECRAKVRGNIQALHANDSDYKFLLDVRAYMDKKVGALEFPDELLRRIMKANNKEKDDKFIDDNYAKSVEELKWHLIKERLVEAQGVKVDDKDVQAAAVQAARYQFAQYGMNNVPDEYLEQYAQETLKRKEQVNQLVERCIDSKLTAALKNVVTLNHKSVSPEDFAKLFEEKK